MKRVFNIRFATLLLLLAVSAAQAGDQHAFFAGRIWPGKGEPIDDAVMVVEDGKITAIGPRKVTNVPATAKRHDLSDSVLIPGLVVAETSLGVASDDDRTLTPEVRAVDGFDFYEDYSPYLAGGVTTVQVSPGRSRLMPGQGSVVKLAGDSPSSRILKDRESLRIVLTNASANPPRIYEPPVGAVSVDNPLKPTRPQISGSLSSRVAGLNAVFTVARESGEGGDELGLETISEYVSKAGTLRATANLASEIRAAMGLAQRYDMKLILVDPTALDSFVARHTPENTPIAGIVLNAGVRPGRISNPAVPDPEARRQKNMWEYAAKLSESGFGDHIAIRPASDSDLDDMLFLGGLFTRSGNEPETVLSMLTTNPATMMGVADKVGSLAAGRDADFVVLNADPFSKGATVLSTWINGESAYDRKRENQMTLVQASQIYVGDGHVLENASVVVGGRKIRGLGRDVSSPPDARLKRFPNGVIVPGYIDLSTGLGLGGSPGTLSLSTKVGERLVADDPSVEFARKGGVTTAVLATSGSPSSMLAFKLGPTPRVLKEPVGIRFTVSTNLTTGLPALKSTLTRAKAYVDGWKKYDKDLAEYKVKLKEYEAAKVKYDAAKKTADAKKKADDAKKKAEEAKKKPNDKKEKETAAQEKKPTPKPGEKKTEPAKKDEKKPETKKPEPKKADPNAPKKPKEPKKPSSSSTMEPYKAAFAGSIPVLVEANTKKTIESAVKLFREEFKLNMILVGGNELYRVPELLASNDVSVSVGPGLIQSVENKTYNLPQILANHGVPFAFQSKATTGVRQLPLAVQYSVHKGLGKTDALAGFTSSASKLLAINDQVGSLGVGKDADLVVLSGPPFEISSEVLAVMIDGEWVYEKEME